MDIDSRRRSSLVLVGFLIVAGFFLATEHRAHLFGILPFLLLLFCPLLLLLHSFMQRGHGSYGGREGDSQRDNRRNDPHRLPGDRTP